MRIIKNYFLKIASSAAVLALVVAGLSASTTCYFVAYQPDLPKALE